MLVTFRVLPLMTKLLLSTLLRPLPDVSAKVMAALSVADMVATVAPLLALAVATLLLLNARAEGAVVSMMAISAGDADDTLPAASVALTVRQNRLAGSRFIGS